MTLTIQTVLSSVDIAESRKDSVRRAIRVILARSGRGAVPIEDLQNIVLVATAAMSKGVTNDKQQSLF